MNKFIKNTFVNREYSWLKFNERVLQEASSQDNPLLEKCKFLSIFSSNLDEFFMVRVGSLFNGVHDNPDAKENKTGLTSSEQLLGIYKYTQKLYKFRMKIAKNIFTELKNEGINIINSRLKSKDVDKHFEKYFQKTMLPLLNPMVLDNKHPLIHLENLNMYVILYLEYGGKNSFGILPVPTKCERLVTHTTSYGTKIMTSEDLIYCFADQIFSKYNVVEKSLVRLTRNADVDIEMYSMDFELEYDFSKLLKGQVRSRSNLPPVRLEFSGDCKAIKSFLCKNFVVEPEQCFTIYYFFDYKFLFSIDKYLPLEKVAQLKYSALKSRQVLLAKSNSLITCVLASDLFLSYPFDSMDTFLDLLDEASVDKRVASIKITIYRVDKQSRIIEALRRAKRNDKEVTVIMELAARFDEENNLYLTEILKEAGCTVVYGVGNYKVHSKIMLIVLREDENIFYITHLGTGNYKETTARQYTDLNIITANKEIGEDAAVFFRKISMGDVEIDCKKLLVAPQNLKKVFLQKIKEQTTLAEAGKPAKIVCKMNSLTDVDFIKEFVKASSAGVKIRLIVRGICCLLPNVAGKTENIEVKSIVGRFLEHSRIYSFGEKKPEIYISSADLMTRNVAKRVEIAAPVIDRRIQSKISKMLEIMLADNEKASYLTEDGEYVRKKEAGESSQQFFIDNVI
ncbi:MAG: polyphosphate kinase 1 [Chitinispirillales bacterium]|nr:polyphosphate kinase 1 [Chitinispirillales bacterium]